MTRWRLSFARWLFSLRRSRIPWAAITCVFLFRALPRGWLPALAMYTETSGGDPVEACLRCRVRRLLAVPVLCCAVHAVAWLPPPRITCRPAHAKAQGGNGSRV